MPQSAKDMPTDALWAEIKELNAKIEDFEKADDEDVCHGGSPAEWLYERYAEVEHELQRRNGL